GILAHSKSVASAASIVWIDEERYTITAGGTGRRGRGCGRWCWCCTGTRSKSNRAGSIRSQMYIPCSCASIHVKTDRYRTGRHTTEVLIVLVEVRGSCWRTQAFHCMP